MTKKLFILLLCSVCFVFQSAAFADRLNLKTLKEPINVKKSKKTYSLGGQLTLKDSVEWGQPYFSASATWKPDSKNYWFIKGTARHNFRGNNKGFRYSWGLGYDDWHEGTWTAQLNNYESLEPGDGFDVESAIASVGYKLKKKFLKDKKLKSTITLSRQVQDGELKLSSSLQWAPKKYWFLKGILVVPLEGSDPHWNYLFGYDDWHPKSFGFEYSNYESNPLSKSNFKKGRLALTYKWKFK